MVLDIVLVRAHPEPPVLLKTIPLATILFAVACPGPAHAKQHPRVTCDMVRSYVARVGLPKAKAMAVAHGITKREARRARECLADKI